eukprot:365205-Chlamydomonas_euryale.AAC.21
MHLGRFACALTGEILAQLFCRPNADLRTAQGCNRHRVHEGAYRAPCTTWLPFVHCFGRCCGVEAGTFTPAAVLAA